MSAPIISAYLARDPKAVALMGGDFQDPAQRKLITERAAKRGLSSEVIALLKEINGKLPASQSREKNLERLAPSGVAFVVTGQQCGLFGGPLLTLYKALSAVKIAQALEAETKIPCIPIFWVQSEDHDLEEIDRAVIFNSSSQLDEFRLGDYGGAPHSSVEHRLLPVNVTEALDAAGTTLERFAAGASVMSELRACYLPGLSTAQSFTEFLARILADEGILFFNPRRAEVSEFARPVFLEALTNRGRISEALVAQSKALAAASFTETVTVRPNSPLFFYHSHGPEGARVRLEETAGDFTLPDGRKLSLTELESAIAKEPNCFSTSALLRPLLQDRLFPTAAYVGGAAEIGYFSQLQPLYRVFGLESPLVIPRAGFVCIEKKSARWLAELRLSATDLALSEEELMRKIAKAGSAETDPQVLEAVTIRGLDVALAEMRRAFVELDQTLVDSLDKSREKILHQISNLGARYARAVATKNGISSERISRLKAGLYPAGKEQERLISSIYYLSRYGDSFKRRILAEINPFNPQMKDLVFDGEGE